MGSSGKTSTSQNSSAFTPQLLSLFNSAKPTLTTLGAQTAEGLRTGGVDSQLPEVSANVAAAREAYSQHTTNLRNQLAESGLANSSFAKDILGENEMTGTQQIASMPANITDSFLGRAIPAVVGSGTSAIQEAARLNTTTNTTPSFMDFFLQSLQAGEQGGATAASGSGGGAGGGTSAAATPQFSVDSAGNLIPAAGTS